jgi:tetratricopeptide (TPR) repeat protein
MRNTFLNKVSSAVLLTAVCSVLTISSCQVVAKTSDGNSELKTQFKQLNRIPFDVVFLPVTTAQLKRELAEGVDDPLAMYQLLRMARKQKLLKPAFETIKELYLEQTQNAVLAAAYCLAYDMGRGDYGDEIVSDPQYSPQDTALRKTALEDAYKLAPKLWLTYSVDGHFQNLQGKSKKGIELIKKAIELAPDISFNYSYLGQAYSANDSDPKIYNLKLTAYEKAQHLKPSSFSASMIMLMIYEVQRPDSKKAAAAAKAAAAKLPPGAVLSEKSRQQLAKYKVVLP